MTLDCNLSDADWDSLALGCLDNQESGALVDHLKTGCPTCLSIYSEAMLTCMAIGSQATVFEPQSGVKKNLSSYVQKRSVRMWIQIQVIQKVRRTIVSVVKSRQ